MASSKKKRSSAYRLKSTASGHHYTIRLSRDAFDKLKEKEIKKHDPNVKAHVKYTIKKT